MPVPLLPPQKILCLGPGIRPDSPSISQTEPRAQGVCEDRRSEATGKRARETNGHEFREEIVGRAEGDPDAEAPEDLARSVIREVIPGIWVSRTVLDIPGLGLDAPRVCDGDRPRNDKGEQEDVACPVEEPVTGGHEAVAQGKMEDKKTCEIAHPLAVRGGKAVSVAQLLCRTDACALRT